MKFKPHYLHPLFIIRALRSLYLSRKVDESNCFIPIRALNPFLKISIQKSPGASINLRGILSIDSYQNGNEPVLIQLCRNSKLIIDGDYIIGNGVKIFLSEGAELHIGGRRDESASGITERTKIMVHKKIHIGYDCIIAWNVFITDCDWHTIEGNKLHSDVFIGDHVWIALNSSILKGSIIGNGCVVASHTLIKGERIPENCLVAGNPPKILKNNIIWHRDMINNE